MSVPRSDPSLAARKAVSSPPEDNDELVAAGDAYATVRDLRQAEGLRFMRRRRRTFTMSCDYRPIPWYDSPDLLLLEYSGFFTVFLHGKRVVELEPLVVDHRITWLRECTPAEAADLAIAVLRADIVHVYPSREEDTSWPGDST